MSFSTHRLSLLLLLTCLSIFAGDRAWGQVTIHGTVYNMYKTGPLAGVSVLSTSGRGTATDSAGNYIIRVNSDDSIYFSYLGRPTMRYPVSGINSLTGFDIALHVDAVTLQQVRVMPKNYHDDSLQNRKDYEKYFNYKKPGVHVSEVGPRGPGMTVGLDLDELINMFRFQQKRRTVAFQHRLIDDEQDAFVDHRFNRSTVLKVTHLEGDELDSFMMKYRPSYGFCKRATDYDLLDYIKLAFREYQKDRKEKP